MQLLFCVYFFSPGLKIRAMSTANTTAAVIPPAAAVRPPVKTPIQPFSATAFFTPLAKLCPKPVMYTNFHQYSILQMM